MIAVMRFGTAVKIIPATLPRSPSYWASSPLGGGKNGTNGANDALQELEKKQTLRKEVAAGVLSGKDGFGRHCMVGLAP